MKFSAEPSSVRFRASIAVALAAGLCTSCSSFSSTPDQPQVVKAEKPFASAGSIEMQLDGGNYLIRPAADDRIRVSFGGNSGNATAELTADGTHARLAVKDTPHDRFQAVVEVPKAEDLVIRLTGGNLEMAAITGNKDIESQAGNAEIAVGNSNDYASVDAGVKVGNLSAGPFGDAAGGLSPHLTWSGHGKYTFRARLGAGNLELK